MQVLVVLLFIAAAGGLMYLAWEAKQRRIRALAMLAASLHLEFSHSDPFALHDKPFRLFRKGDGRGCENVMWGTSAGHAVTAFDYWYYETSHNPKGGSSRQYYRFSCAVVASRLAAQHLTIGPEGILTRLAGAIGFRDIQFESDEFNDRVKVNCDDERFASYLIDARMMQWILEAEGWAFEVHGAEALAFAGKLKPDAFANVIGAAIAFTEQFPRAALDVYGGP